MAQKIDKELQEAILFMPQAEKDKLLLRLIRKDPMLISQLTFELLGSQEEMVGKREELLAQIKKSATYNYSHTPGLVMMEIRSISGEITRHVKVTKDKEGEIELFLTLLLVYFQGYESVLRQNPHRTETFAPYVVKKLKFVLGKLNKLHEDYHLEYEDTVAELLNFIWDYAPTAKVAAEEKLPKQWK